MNDMIPWIAAEAGPPEIDMDAEFPEPGKERSPRAEEVAGLPAHQFPASVQKEEALPETGAQADTQQPAQPWVPEEFYDYQRERRIYRGRTVGMLKRYMRYSLETGRLPSLVGREFFRAKITKYRVNSFEDRVIFVHDMERCLEKLDEFSRQVLARVVLQEYEHWEAARLLGCTRMTVHRKLLEALDRLSDILREVELLGPVSPNEKKSCQEGEEGGFFLSDCDERK